MYEKALLLKQQTKKLKKSKERIENEQRITYFSHCYILKFIQPKQIKSAQTKISKTILLFLRMRIHINKILPPIQLILVD